MEKVPALEIRDLSIGYGERTVLRDLNFTVQQGEIFAVMGGSGCGKSTLLKHIIGIYPVQRGSIKIFGREITGGNAPTLDEIARLFGVTYQGGALLGSLTLAENVALVLQEHTNLSSGEIQNKVMEKLALVNLENFADFLPSEISGGMKKRAGLARALVMEPPLLFFDEPSAGLDPVSSAELDRLILKMRDQENRTVVLITHELDSVFAVADRIIMLDKNTKTIAAEGDPRVLKEECPCDWVRNFLNRDGLIYTAQQAGQQLKTAF
ncbi:MAG: ATP-binding cassette domain-containing protein [Lentisphaerae bacterium]|nr:ATP-binding cassette domain-containing protein [Lentisphaerota bacterium]